MKKALTVVALLALLAVPFFVVSAAPAKAQVCPQGVNWSAHQDPPLEDVGSVEYCVKGGSAEENTNRCVAYLERGSFEEVSAIVGGENACELSHWSYKLERPTEVPTRVPPTETPEPPTLEVSCAGWRVKQDGETIEGAAWEDPFSLEVHFSEVLQQRIREPEECLQEKGDPTLRIGGRCTEDGDSQEIGYVFDDGDYGGAKLRITRQDGVVVLEGAGEGSDFFPARAADYTWQIIWFNGETREVLDEGEFSVAKCDLPEPTPTPKPPPEHPPTGGEMDAGLAVVTGLMGFALAGIGGSILFMKRRASS